MSLRADGQNLKKRSSSEGGDTLKNDVNTDSFKNFVFACVYACAHVRARLLSSFQSVTHRECLVVAIEADGIFHHH